MSFTMNGQPGAPEFWPDGNPKMNIRIILATDLGELKTFTFQPAGRMARMRQKKSVHMDLFDLSGGDMANLLGKTIVIETQEGHYGQGNPRPWKVSLADEGYGPFSYDGQIPAELMAPKVLANQATSGGQVQAPQQYRQPQPQPQPQQYQQPAYQPPQMNPAIAQQMVSQAFGQHVPVQQMQPTQTNPVGNGMAYDEDMPF